VANHATVSINPKEDSFDSGGAITADVDLASAA
jgi:hypothetical protein